MDVVQTTSASVFPCENSVKGGSMATKAIAALSTFNQRLCRFLTVLIGGILAAISIILFHSVVMRYLFNNPVTWSEDAAKFLLVWMTLLGAPAGMRAGTHVAVELITDKLPQPIQKVFQLLSLVVVLYVSWMIVSQGWSFALQGMRRIVPSLPWLPFGFAYLALPIGYALIGLICIELILTSISGLISGQER
jgi:TRAP-type C4-dicarboxylate transport system permease small subunit